MPANRPGRVVYETNDTGDTLQHGAPIALRNRVGVTIKQTGRGWDSTVAQQSVIDESEQFAIIVKGKVLVDNVAGFAKGDAVYIIAATGVLTETASGNVPFGRVTEIPLERGTPTGKVWIDLDAKDSIDTPA